jgi:hypothetical protein
MVTRKSGDGSRSEDVGSERPGSYVKVSSSRRRRKRRGSTMPPPDASLPSDERRIVDTVGEDEEGRISEPGGILVDDLRRGSRPSSSRPRNELGPLGMEESRTEPPASPVGSDRPRVLQVIEINASEPLVPDPFGEEVTTTAPLGSLFDDDEDALAISEIDRELAREYALDDLRPSESELYPTPSPSPGGLVLRDAYDAQEARHSLSSVLGARPSLRPSPRPERQSDSASTLWWLVVAALVAIIAAAGAIAAREQFASEDEPAPAPRVREPVRPPVVEARKPRPVSFGSPQSGTLPQPPIKVEPAKPVPPVRTPQNPSAPSAVPAAQSAAVRAGAPDTSAVTGAASAARPAALPSVGRSSERKAKAVKASGAESAASYAPGYDKSLGGAAYAPGYDPAASDPGAKPAPRPAPEAARGKPDLTPADDSRDNELPGLPLNPYQ